MKKILILAAVLAISITTFVAGERSKSKRFGTNQKHRDTRFNQADTLVYAGYGRLSEVAPGVVIVFPAHKLSGRSIGFDVVWTKEVQDAAAENGGILHNFIGNLEVHYQESENLLQIQLTDAPGNDRVFRYSLNESGNLTPQEFSEHFVAFRDFLAGSNFDHPVDGDDSEGWVAQDICPGGSCRATLPSGSTCCSACCSVNRIPDCTYVGGGNCVCVCGPPPQ